MDQNVIDDLKQFITTTVSQQTTEIRQEMREGFTAADQKFASIDKKLDDLSASVAEAIEASNEVVATQLRDHEQRITRLEQHTA